MKSGVSYVDRDEAARWIAAQLQKEGLLVSDGLVARILDEESMFLVMLGLARGGHKDSVQCGYVHREEFWMREPATKTRRDQQLQPPREETG